VARNLEPSLSTKSETCTGVSRPWPHPRGRDWDRTHMLDWFELHWCELVRTGVTPGSRNMTPSSFHTCLPAHSPEKSSPDNFG